MKPIYLQLHYKDTKRAIAEHISNYNDQILKERPNEFKRLKIKSPVEATIHAVLDMFAKFLQNNESKNLEKPVFKVNNQAIRTKLNNRCSKVTIWRHLKRATDCGIFNKSAYVFHGTNSSFEIGFNPEILAACYHPEFSELVVKNYQILVNNLEIPVEKLADLFAIRPLFSDSFNGYMISFCNHIVPVKNLQEQNINMESGVNVHSASLSFSETNINNLPETEKSVSTGTFLQEQGSIDPGQKITVPSPFHRQGSRERLEQRLGGRAAKKVEQKPDYDLLLFFIESSIRLVLSVLYKERFVADHDIEVAKKFLWDYFTPKDKTKKLSDLKTDLEIAVFEAYKAQHRKFYIPAPLYRYFDPHFQGGFYKTLRHVETYVKPYMEKNKEYSKSVSDVMKLYTLHMKNPNDYECYRRSAQLLGKKQNKQYLNFFNTCVSQPEQFNSNTFYNQWKQSINQPNQAY